VDLLVGRVSVIRTHAFNQELHFFFIKALERVLGSGEIREEEKDSDTHQDGRNTFNDEDPLPNGWFREAMSVNEEEMIRYLKPVN
jgi:hypothetical protein